MGASRSAGSSIISSRIVDGGVKPSNGWLIRTCREAFEAIRNQQRWDGPKGKGKVIAKALEFLQTLTIHQVHLVLGWRVSGEM